jgi:hypothetical protein
VRREISHVLGKQLSPTLQRWADAYGKVGQRNLYLWKWCRQGVEVTTLPGVLPDLRDCVCDTKVLGIMLDVLLDDIADRNGDDALLEELATLPLDRATFDFSGLSTELRSYAEFTVQVWQDIQQRAQQFPCYREYAKLLRFDYLQLFNVMRYSHLVNQNLALVNLVEHDLYTPHNMHMMISSTLDLMCFPQFDRSELGKVREVIWNAQCMGRIGNLVTTWQRELGEDDFTSGVYARALANGDVSVADLHQGDRQKVEAAIQRGRHEEYFLKRWQEHRRYLQSRRSAVHSFDVTKLVEGLERLICLHLGSRGYK